MNDKKRLTQDDLELIFIRVQDEQGKWGNVDVKSATDQQFDTWAKTRLTIEGEDTPWSLSERSAFCNQLWQAGALHMLKREAE